MPLLWSIPSEYAAGIFLGTVFLLSLGMGARSLFRSGRYSLVERLLYFPVYCLARILWRVEIHWDPRWDSALDEGASGFGRMLRDRVNGGAVLIANHRASVDPFFVQLAAGTRVHWMVAGEYFKHPLFGGLLRAYQAIPTRRGGADNGATKQAIRLARSGRFVGMFPEGRINRSVAPLLSIRPGAALVASKSNTPIIPIWIDGAPVGPEVYSALFMSARVRVYIGFPLVAPQRLEGESSSEKGLYLEWISQAMEESLRLGRCEGGCVELAGAQWVH